MSIASPLHLHSPRGVTSRHDMNLKRYSLPPICIVQGTLSKSGVSNINGKTDDTHQHTSHTNDWHRSRLLHQLRSNMHPALHASTAAASFSLSMSLPVVGNPYSASTLCIPCHYPRLPRRPRPPLLLTLPSPDSSACG